MMRRMSKRLLALLIVALSVSLAPVSAMADDSAPKSYDGRLDNYGRQVTLDSGGTALCYFLFAGLGVIALGGMFRNARRTHLD
jgi:hypothetical protein